MSDWRPNATPEVLQRRAWLNAAIRQFMASRNILEVETPLLARHGVSDPHLHNLTSSCSIAGRHTPLYLQTSPEYAMKRLLASGSGPIYQIARAFRAGEQGRWHNHEFTLLEWYRPGYDHLRLMSEMQELFAILEPGWRCQRRSYAAVFMACCGLDPHRATAVELQAWLHSRDLDVPALDGDRDALLDLILSHEIAPGLGRQGPLFLYDYPASQAALARIRPGSPPIAERFEVYLQGLEIANGFHELGDAREQRARFEADNDHRRRLGLPSMPIDDYLLSALEHGLPDCAGVAVGLDRLLMVLSGAETIAGVLAFPADRA